MYTSIVTSQQTVGEFCTMCSVLQPCNASSTIMEYKGETKLWRLDALYSLSSLDQPILSQYIHLMTLKTQRFRCVAQ